MKRKVCTFLVFLGFLAALNTQARGVLLPRMTNEERDAIVNPVPGLMIFNSDEMVERYLVSQFRMILQVAITVILQMNS